jgi:hypothetical protein
VARNLPALHAFALPLLLSAIGGCSDPPPCPDTNPPVFVITLADTKTQAYVCNATIGFTNDTSGWNVASTQLPDGSCQYQSWASVGTYTVTVTAPGYERAYQTGLAVSSDTCGIMSLPPMVIGLNPAADAGGPPPYQGEAGAPRDDGGGGASEAGGWGGD